MSLLKAPCCVGEGFEVSLGYCLFKWIKWHGAKKTEGRRDVERGREKNGGEERRKEGERDGVRRRKSESEREEDRIYRKVTAFLLTDPKTLTQETPSKKCYHINYMYCTVCMSCYYGNTNIIRLHSWYIYATYFVSCVH